MTRFELAYSFYLYYEKYLNSKKRKQAIPSALHSTEQAYALLDFLLVWQKISFLSEEIQFSVTF